MTKILLLAQNGRYCASGIDRSELFPECSFVYLPADSVSSGEVNGNETLQADRFDGVALRHQASCAYAVSEDTL